MMEHTSIRLLLLYTSVLLLASIFVPVISDESKFIPKAENMDEEKVMNEFSIQLSNGRVQEINPQLLWEENSFEYRGQALKFPHNSEDILEVFIQRESSNDNKIEV